MATEKMTIEDFPVAIMWLESNEGEEGSERERCMKAAAFLKAEYDRRQEERIKRLAKRHGVPIEAVRNIVLGEQR
jgi:hypothetical protein